MHGSRKELGVGLVNKILKDLGLKCARLSDQSNPDNGTLLVTCPALPEVATFGDGAADAASRTSAPSKRPLRRAWRTAKMSRGHQRGPALARSPAPTVLKVQLYRQLREAGITRAELARRLGWKRESVDRLFRLDHASRLQQLQAAFAALGQRFAVRSRADVIIRRADRYAGSPAVRLPGLFAAALRDRRCSRR